MSSNRSGLRPSCSLKTFGSHNEKRSTPKIPWLVSMRHSACSHAEPGLTMSAHPCSRKRGAADCQPARILCRARRWTARSAAPRRCRQTARPAAHTSAQYRAAGADKVRQVARGGAHPGWGRGSGPPRHSPASSLPRRQSQTLPGWRPPGPCRGVRLSCWPASCSHRKHWASTGRTALWRMWRLLCAPC